MTLSGVDVSPFRLPLGPVAIISPFNLPAMVPMWFLPITIAAGNTVVLEPSEKVPSAALWLARLWADAGLPAVCSTSSTGTRSPWSVWSLTPTSRR
jgi:malonate-semialdehyde dehydrogenase (acetylating) / methylmalonate-semialdehyde dehydrogenase